MNKDRLSQIPKDIRELILYETQPEDLDTLCEINQEMEDSCQDERVLNRYFNYHKLYQQKGSYLDMLHIINIGSIVLIQHLINLLQKYNLLSILNIQIIIQLLNNNKNISDTDLIHLFKQLPLSDEILHTLTYESVLNNRYQLIQWLKDEHYFQYRDAIHASVKSNNVGEFINSINSLNSVILGDDYIMWDVLVEEILDFNPDPYFIVRLLAIKNPKIVKLLDEVWENAIKIVIDRQKDPDYEKFSKQYGAIYDILADHLNDIYMRTLK